MATVLISTAGTHGDVLQFIEMGRGLRQRGHEVVVYTHAFYADLARRAGLSCVPIDTEDDYSRHLVDTRNLLSGQLTGGNGLVEFMHRNRLFDQIRFEYERMGEVIRARGADRVVLFGHHYTALSTLLVREAYGVPAAWAAVSPDQFLTAGLTHRIFPTYLGEPMNRLRAALGLAPVGDWPAWLSSVDLSLGMWPAWFDAAGGRAPDPAVLTGFVLNPAVTTGPLPPELDEIAGTVPPAERPVLISAGSTRLLHDRWYEVAIAACRQLGRAGVLVTRHRDLLPPQLPAGIRWYPSLPFRSAMRAASVVLHHGGILTCACAVAAGLPQVILAHGGDRPDNASRLRRLGLGEWLPSARWRPAAVTALLRQVVEDPGYARRARELAPSIDAVATVAQVCRRLEALVGTRPAAPPTGGHRLSDRVANLTPERRAALAARLRDRRGTAGRPADPPEVSAAR